MTVYVSNKQVSSRQAYTSIYTLIYIGDQGIVYLFVGTRKLDGALFGDDVKKFVSGLIILYDRRVAAS